MRSALTELWFRSAPLVAGSIIVLLWTALVFVVAYFIGDRRAWARAKRRLPKEVQEQITVLRDVVAVRGRMLSQYLHAYMRICEQRNVSIKLAKAIQEELARPDGVANLLEKEQNTREGI